MLRFDSDPGHSAYHEEDDFDIENQKQDAPSERHLAKAGAKVFASPQRHPSERKRTSWSRARGVFACKQRRLARLACCLCLCILAVLRAGFQLDVDGPDSPLRISSSVLLMVGAILSAASIAIRSIPDVVHVLAAACLLAWALAGEAETTTLPVVVAFVQLVLLQWSDTAVRFACVVDILTLAAIAVQSGLWPSWTLGASLVFFLFGMERRVDLLWGSTISKQPRKEISEAPRVIIISSEEINGEESARAIESAKRFLERRRPNIHARIEKCRIRFNDLQLDEKIGYGSFGEVYKAHYNGESVAVKRIPRDQITEHSVSGMLTEVDVLSGCQHPNIVRLIGWCDDPCVAVCLEFANGGSLADFLKNNTDKLSIGWSIMKTRMAMDAATGLAFIHGQNLVHRDIKADNLLVFTAPGSISIKLADFGSSRNISQHFSMTAVGSPYWLAPEVALGSRDYNDKADVWSFGVTICEIMTHAMPYEDLRSNESYFNLIAVSQGRISPVEQLEMAAETLYAGKDRDEFESIFSIVSWCCSFDPEKRPAINLVLFDLLELMVEESSNVSIQQVVEDQGETGFDVRKKSSSRTASTREDYLDDHYADEATDQTVWNHTRKLTRPSD